MNKKMFEPSYDPYDLWSTRLGVEIKRKYYSGTLPGKIGAVSIGLIDWLLPNFERTVSRAKKRSYPIVIAQGIQILSYGGRIKSDHANKLLGKLQSVSTDPFGKNGWSWGLGFPWMSKNGLYPESLAFITHTPYAMEALLVLAKDPALEHSVMEIFDDTLSFLKSLQIMHEDAVTLALSYAPVHEPRIVVNANSYAAFAYALHAVYGDQENQIEARGKAEKLTNWVIQQQQENGSWFYYADDEPGNFIDCFHSCFVVKNLLKVLKLMPNLTGKIDPVASKGWRYIQNTLYDEDKGLCRRFSVRAQRDPFRWDLYDQAEYLGLLIDFGELTKATTFAQQVEKIFSRAGTWHCRIDIFGRLWGGDFLRWGIVPFLYHHTRLQKALAGEK